MGYCLDYALAPSFSIYKLDIGSRICILISNEVLDHIKILLDYKFPGKLVGLQSSGVLLSWTKTEDYAQERERDRTYMMCAYMLRSAIPDLWDCAIK